MKPTMFERLQELPLLMGLSVNELVSVVEQVKFAFEKYQEGYTIVNQWDRCDKIVFVLSGSLCAYRRDDENGLIIQENFRQEPFLIEPQNLWGMNQKYERTYSFTTEGSTCSIEKRQLGFLISKYEVVKTNVMNLICNRLQSVTSTLREKLPSTTEEKLLRLLRQQKISLTGSTTVKVTMKQLAYLVADTRLNVSSVLNDWKDQGLIELQRGNIFIIDDTNLFNR